MPLDPSIIAALTPAWRTVVIRPFGELQVRNPTVADAAMAPALCWWRSCVRMPDGTEAFPVEVDMAALDAESIVALREAVFDRGAARPTPPPTGGE